MVSIYEPQLALPPARTCGAAALCMTYRTLGIECQQREIWDRLSRYPHSRHSARAFALAADAIAQGVAALVVQVREPWSWLQDCSRAGVQVILNHRLSEASPWGHYSLLESLDDDSIWLHDPQVGPHRRLQRDQLLRLWQGALGRTEIAGHVAVVLGHADSSMKCSECRTSIPDAFECPNCNCINYLQPSFTIGCVSAQCPGRRWRRIFCPHCDWAEQGTIQVPHFRRCEQFDERLH